MPLSAVLFDLDGTLIDTAPDFILAVNSLRAEQNLPPLPEDDIRKTVSDGARALITLAFNLEEGDDGFEPLRERLLELYTDNICVHSALFEGMQSVLDQLAEQGIPWGIVTNKPSRFTDPLLAQLDIKPAPQSVICPDHVAITKPDPEGVLLACKQMGADASNAIYVGDHIRDIDAGKNARMKTIACGYGYVSIGDNSHNWNADYHVDHASEIGAIIEQLHAVTTA